MRKVYRVLAFLVAIEVAVQAMFIVYGDAGLGLWVDDGGVVDKATFEDAIEGGAAPFPEFQAFLLHGMNGMMVIPALALLLVISSFFAKVPRGDGVRLRRPRPRGAAGDAGPDGPRRRRPGRTARAQRPGAVLRGCLDRHPLALVGGRARPADSESASALPSEPTAGRAQSASARPPGRRARRCPRGAAAAGLAVGGQPGARVLLRDDAWAPSTSAAAQPSPMATCRAPLAGATSRPWSSPTGAPRTSR